MPISLLLSALSRLAQIVPESWLYRAAAAAARAAIPFMERRRLRVRNNLERIHPDWGPQQLNPAVAAVFAETARYYVDLALLPNRSARQIFDQHLDLHGLQHLTNAHASGGGLVLTSPHLSNPEVALKALAALEIPAAALIEPLTDPRQRDAVADRRAAAGIDFQPATAAGVAHCLRLLREGGVVCVLWDRDIQGGGPCIPFFGRQARFPVGAIDLALRSQAALLPLYAVRDRDHGALRFRVEFLPPQEFLIVGNRALDVRTNLANLAALYEPIIAEHADQWRVFESPWAPCHDSPYDDPRPRAQHESARATQ